jgi:hypothetical protein
MPPIKNTVAGANLTTALGGTPAAESDIIIMSVPGGAAPTYNAGTDLSTNEINTFRVSGNFRGQLGVAGTNVKVDLSAATYDGLLYYDGKSAGDAYFEAKTDIQKTIIKRTGRGTFYAAAGTFTLLEMDDGKLNVGGSAVLVTGTLNGGNLTILDNATAVTSLTAKNLMSGMIQRAVTTAVFKQCPGLVFDSYADAIATLTLEDSTLVYNGDDITQLYGLPGGVLDLSDVTDDIAITDSTLHAGFRVIHPNNGFTVTWTNTPTFVGGGPDWWQ